MGMCCWQCDSHRASRAAVGTGCARDLLASLAYVIVRCCCALLFWNAPPICPPGAPEQAAGGAARRASGLNATPDDRRHCSYCANGIPAMLSEYCRSGIWTLITNGSVHPL